MPEIIQNFFSPGQFGKIGRDKAPQRKNFYKASPRKQHNEQDGKEKGRNCVNPCIYYGDEAGMEGFDDPFNRGTYPWGNEDIEVMDMSKKMISLRQDYPLFTDGKIEIIYSHGKSLAFARFSYEKLMIVSVNMNSQNHEFTRIDLARFRPEVGIDIESNEEMELVNGVIFYNLPPLGYRIFEVDLEGCN